MAWLLQIVAILKRNSYRKRIYLFGGWLFCIILTFSLWCSRKSITLPHFVTCVPADSILQHYFNCLLFLFCFYCISKFTFQSSLFHMSFIAAGFLGYLWTWCINVLNWLIESFLCKCVQFLQGLSCKFDNLASLKWIRGSSLVCKGKQHSGLETRFGKLLMTLQGL